MAHQVNVMDRELHLAKQGRAWNRQERKCAVLELVQFSSYRDALAPKLVRALDRVEFLEDDIEGSKSQLQISLDGGRETTKAKNGEIMEPIGREYFASLLYLGTRTHLMQ